MPPKTLDKPQRRRQIGQLVCNAFPTCTAEFVAAPAGGIAFRVRAANGRYRSGVIKLLAHHGHIRLNHAWLMREMKADGDMTRRRRTAAAV
jgi:hypothetical protein